MNRLRKIYFVTLFGVLGGLIGSVLHQSLLLDTLAKPLDLSWRFAGLAVLGALIGLPIGFFPHFSERLGNYSLVGAARAGLIGAFWGSIGGLVALPVAETIHVYLGGGYRGRPVAFALLGVAVGIAEGISGGSRLRHAVVGGVFGGLLAGAILEFLVGFETTRNMSGIAALGIIGGAIAFSICAFVTVLSEARLEGVSGLQVKQRIFHLGKFREPTEAIIGSDRTKPLFICLKDAEPIHAGIMLTSDGTRLRNLAAKEPTRVNGRPVREQMLRDGDVLDVGHTRFLYRERRGHVLATAGLAKAKRSLASPGVS